MKMEDNDLRYSLMTYQALKLDDNPIVIDRKIIRGLFTNRFETKFKEVNPYNINLYGFDNGKPVRFCTLGDLVLSSETVQ